MDYDNDPMALFDNPSRLGLSSYNSFLTYPSINPYSASRNAKTNSSKRHNDYVEKSRKQQVEQFLYSGNVQSEVHNHHIMLCFVCLTYRKLYDYYLFFFCVCFCFVCASQTKKRLQQKLAEKRKNNRKMTNKNMSEKIDLQIRKIIELHNNNTSNNGRKNKNQSKKNGNSKNKNNNKDKSKSQNKKTEKLGRQSKSQPNSKSKNQIQRSNDNIDLTNGHINGLNKAKKQNKKV